MTRLLCGLTIFCLTILLCLPQSAFSQETASGRDAAASDDYEILFDGSSLDKWRGYRQEAIGKGWKIDGDALMFDGSGGGDICTQDEYGDFEFTFSWKVSEGANSGIMYRVTLGDGAPYISGPEYQILDDSKHADGRSELTSAAALYGLYPCENKTLESVGEWNTGKIVQRGNTIEHWLNGQKVVEAEIGGEDWNQRIANSKFKDWEKFGKSPRGRIALQDHGDKIWFKDIKIKRLDSEK